MPNQILIVLSLALPALCLADATLKYQGNKDPSSVTSIQVKDGDVLMGDQQSKMLYKAGRNEIIIIDHPRRTYMVLDEEAAKRMEQQMSGMQQQMNVMMQQMQQQMAQMSDEEREQMKKLLGSGMMSGAKQPPVKTTIQRHGKSEVAGIDCEKVTLLSNGKPSSKICVAPPNAVHVDSRDYEALLAATDAVKSIVQRMTGRLSGDIRSMSLNMRDMRGIPVLIHDLEHDYVSTLISHSDGKLDPSSFEIPKEYRRQQMVQ